jgi:hypothetical protein
VARRERRELFTGLWKKTFTNGGHLKKICFDGMIILKQILK